MPRRTHQQTLQDELWIAYYRSIDLILLNLIWFLFTVPVITAVPALGGLFYATNHMAREGSGSWRDFWLGFRSCFWLSWRWGLINAAVLVFLSLNVWWYSQAEGPWLAGVQWILIGLIVVWIALQLFTFPLLLEQSDQRFVVALRNSAVMWLRYPWLAVAAILQIALLAVPSTLFFPPAWVIITASYCAYHANRAVLKSIQNIKRAGSA